MKEKTLSGFDLGSFDGIDQATKMNVCHPGTGVPLLNEAGENIFIEVYGKDSDVYRKTQRGITDRRLKARQGSITAERIEAEATEVLAACTKSWNLVVDGAVPDCNAGKAKTVYARFKWLKEQVDDYIAERANFLAD